MSAGRQVMCLEVCLATLCGARVVWLWGIIFSGDCKLLCGCYFTRIVCLLYEKCTKLEVTLSWKLHPELYCLPTKLTHLFCPQSNLHPWLTGAFSSVPAILFVVVPFLLWGFLLNGQRRCFERSHLTTVSCIYHHNKLQTIFLLTDFTLCERN